LFSCCSCQKDITTQFRLRCAECVETVDLCADCFSVGVTALSVSCDHKASHNYRIVDCLDIPSVFNPDWSVAEELLLLEGRTLPSPVACPQLLFLLHTKLYAMYIFKISDPINQSKGIDKHGSGNWKFISEYMSSSKSTKQCEEHYWETYMGRFGRCLPIPPELEGGEKIEQFLVSKGISAGESEIPVTEGHSRDELVVRDKGKERQAKDKQELRERQALLPGDKKHLPLVVIASHPPHTHTPPSTPPTPHEGADLPGFMPLREDFDVEYENDAENLLADMEFSPDDHPSERELKLQIVRIYNLKLAERDRRKRFVIERGLVDCKKQQNVSANILLAPSQSQ
jgi:transcriptional adapter 2-alpha